MDPDYDFPRDMTCCFTGHRPQSLPWGYDEDSPECVELKGVLLREILTAVERGYSYFFHGGALGTDLIAAEIVASMKRGELCSLFPGIAEGLRFPVTLHAALPCPEQPHGWPSALKDRYFELLRSCDSVKYISDRYTASCFHERNRYMVARSSLVIAVWDGSRRGGTWNTVRYAMNSGVSVVSLSPRKCGQLSMWP